MSFILRTKINKPPLSERLVSRLDQIEKLNSGLSRKLIVISAPAGYGKTTILCQWLEHINQQAAWYSIDKSDNDNVHFFTYLVSAIQTIHPTVGNDALKMLQSQTKPPSMEYILGSFINDTSSIETDILLVIDDYHLINSMEIHENLNYLIEHLPHQMHIVIASRSDPPLKLARLRSQNQMIDLRADDLSFTNLQSETFFNKIMHLNLTKDEIEKLNKRIEGWPAGLQMAAVTMQGKQDVSHFVNVFTGSSRYIMDYLIEEVFSSQPEPIQKFLLRTSILNQMNDTLCNLVSGQINGQDILEELDQKNLFIISLDEHRRWYRYHNLFSDLLQKRLKHSFPDQVKDLHQRASLGFEQQEMIPEAIEHALTAEDFSRAEELISKIAKKLWFRGEQGTLLRWAALLPKRRQNVNPELYAIFAKCVALDGRFDEADTFLDVAEGNLDENDNQVGGMISAVRAYITDYRGDAESAEKYGMHALSSLNDKHAIWRCLASMAMGDVYVQKGPLKPATDSYQEAIRSSTIAGNNFIISLAKHRVVVMYHRRGKLRTATQLVEEYLSEENPLTNQSGALNLVYGELLYEMNRLNEAREQISKSIQICQFQQHAAAIPYCKMQLARIHFARQNKGAAALETKESMHLLEQSDMAPWVEGFVYAWNLRYYILHGKLNRASALVKERELTIDGIFTYPNFSEYLAFARYLAAGGKYKDVLRLLDRLLDRLFAIDWRNLAYEAQLLQAQVFQKTGQSGKAIKTLISVLKDTEHEGYLRLFIDEGEPLVELLKIVQKQNIYSDYIDKICFEIRHISSAKSTSGGSTISDNMESLSDREMEVLRLLKTDLTSTEIADELFISVNTARSHIKSIYNKLGVHNRREVVKKAQRQNLI